MKCLFSTLFKFLVLTFLLFINYKFWLFIVTSANINIKHIKKGILKENISSDTNHEKINSKTLSTFNNNIILKEFENFINTHGDSILNFYKNLFLVYLPFYIAIFYFWPFKLYNWVDLLIKNNKTTFIKTIIIYIIIKLLYFFSFINFFINYNFELSNFINFMLLDLNKFNAWLYFNKENFLFFYKCLYILILIHSFNYLFITNENSNTFLFFILNFYILASLQAYIFNPQEFLFYILDIKIKFFEYHKLKLNLFTFNLTFVIIILAPSTLLLFILFSICKNKSKEEILYLFTLITFVCFIEIGAWLVLDDFYFSCKDWYNSKFGVWCSMFFLIFSFPISFILIPFQLVSNIFDFVEIISETSVAIIFYYFLLITKSIIYIPLVTPGMFRATLLDEYQYILNYNLTYGHFTKLNTTFEKLTYKYINFFFTPNQYPIFILFYFIFFITVLVSFIFLSYLGLYGVFIINLISIFCLWISLLFYIDLIFIKQVTYNIYLFKWFFINYNFKVNFNFLIDTISFSFFLLTTTIGLFVYMYAFCYFRYEPLVERFLLFLCSFILSMLFLVSSGNTIMIFLGWELIGLTSFFLINFWTTKISTLKSAFKAFSFNKISDFLLLFSFIIIYCLTYDIDVLSINNQIHLFTFFKIKLLNININIIELISFLLLSCSFIKSAQLGPHIWLPDSMEAPVPASSLIHSATLVSAGVFIILRFFPIFENSYYAYLILPLIGSLTAAYGGVVAAYQSDIKRILAYSTISHCGFLILLTSLNINEFVILYLYIHGFFKAAVFMCVGNIIRISRNYQDFRKMGLFYKYLPFELFVSFICLFNLAGLPFTCGFYIKHLIFLGFSKHIWFNSFILFNVFVGAISGLFYSYRIIFYVFFDFKKANKNIYNSLNKKNYFSEFYSNTSQLSNISILLLTISSYVISFYMFSILLSKNFNASDFNNYSINTNFYNYFNIQNNFLLFNFSFLNWLVILFIWSFIFLNWRNTFYLHQIYASQSDIIIMSIFMFFFLNIL